MGRQAVPQRSFRHLICLPGSFKSRLLKHNRRESVGLPMRGTCLAFHRRVLRVEIVGCREVPVMNATELQPGTGRNDKQRWAAIEREIQAALSQTELSLHSRRCLHIEVSPTGIVLSGEVMMGWERDLAKVIAQSHSHGLQVVSQVRMYGQSTAPFNEEQD
jgi:hypothetical protein